MQNNSLWKDEVEIKLNYPHLQGPLKVDTVIVGAGITGITAAYLLSKAGKKVALIDKSQILSGETMYTTAFLNYPIDAELSALKKTFGEKTAVRVWQSVMDAIYKVEEIIWEEKIDCEFVRAPLYFYAVDDKGYKILQNEYSIARKNDFPVFLEEGNIGITYDRYLRCENNAKFHPLKYLSALLKKAESYGAVILENTEAIAFEEDDPAVVKIRGGEIHAENVIIATHNPPATFEANSRIFPYQSYVIAAKIPPNRLAEAMYIDTNDPYFYFRVDKKGEYDRLILGGADHLTGEMKNTQMQFDILENYLNKILPDLKYEITNRWSGQILETTDGLPFVGPTIRNKHHLVATGFAGDGMVFGTLSAMINADFVLGKENEWAQIYSLKRVKKIGNFLKQGAQYVKKMIEGREASRGEMDLVRAGSGKVVEMNGEKMAVYKDRQGNVIKMSPVCPHMGCIVEFNEFEKTWDCPCHGSRFNKFGAVINGPAVKPLNRIK